MACAWTCSRPAWVRSDRRLLRRVLQNFLANALRYRQGRIVLAVRQRGDEVELQVWDTGPGIPEHHMRQIFDEFHRYRSVRLGWQAWATKPIKPASLRAFLGALRVPPWPATTM